MSAPYAEDDTGVAESSFQSIVHEPFFGVWMKAKVRNFAPDSADSVAGLSLV
jgi:hypothetical protein